MNETMPHPIEELDEQAQAMRVYWRKLHNYANNLAKTYLETKKLFETGRFGPDWTHGRWILRCGLGPDQLVKIITLHARTMAAEDRERMEVERDQRAKERRDKAEERRQDRAAARAAAKIRREAEARALAEDKRERAAAKAAAKAAKTEAAKRARAERSNAKAKKERARARTKQVAAPPDTPALVGNEKRAAFLAGKADEIRAAQAELEQSAQAWIEGTMRLAIAFAAARDQFRSNTAFGKWLKESGLTFSKEERPALIHMGRFPAETRFTLLTTNRRSYDYIWRKELKPHLESEGLLSLHNEDEKSELEIA